MIVNHPLKEGTNITASYPACPCTGKKWQQVSGKIIKISTYGTDNKYLYQLHTGHSVKDEWVQTVS